MAFWVLTLASINEVYHGRLSTQRAMVDRSLYTGEEFNSLVKVLGTSLTMLLIRVL